MWPEPVSELGQVPVRTHADFFHNLADFPKIYNMCLRTHGKQPINSSSPHRPARFNLSAHMRLALEMANLELSNSPPNGEMIDARSRFPEPIRTALLTLCK